MRSDYDHGVRFVLDLGNETAVSSNQFPHQRLVKDELVEGRHVRGYADAGDAGRGWGCDVAAPFAAVARTLLKKIMLFAVLVPIEPSIPVDKGN